MDFRRLLLPGWAIEMERFAADEAARNHPDRTRQLKRWAGVLVVVGLILIGFGFMTVFMATPGRYHADGIPHGYAWYGLAAVLVGLGLVWIVRRFGISSRRIDDGDA